MNASIQRTRKTFWINAHSIFKCNRPKTEIPTSIYKIGAPSVKLPLISWLFMIFLNFGYVHIINSGLNKCIY